MAKFAAILFVAFAFQAVWAAPSTPTGEKNALEQLTEQIQTATNDLTATLEKNIPDAKDVNEAIATHSTELIQGFESILKKFQTEIDSNKGKRDDLLKDVSGKLSNAIVSLQELSGPDATKKADELKAQLESNVQNIATELENFGKTIQPNLQKTGDNIGTFASGVFDDFIKATKTFQTQVKDAVEKH